MEATAAAAVPAPVLPHGRSNRLSTRRVLLATVCGCFLVQAILVFNQSVNWDEFRFLSDVHLLARGELAASVQTFHAHFFQWLLLLPGHEIDRIVAARLVMLLLEAGTAAMLYRCARRFSGPEASLGAVLCYLTFAYVARHGASFRFDPPSTFLLMTATALLTAGKLRLATTAAVGALVAVAALITIKAVFYVPTLLVIALWRISEASDRASAIRQAAIGALIGAAVLGLLFLYHHSHLAAELPGGAQDIVAGSVDKTIGQSRLLPQAPTLLRSLVESPVNWLILASALSLAVREAIRARPSARLAALALLSFALPLGTLLFYRNAFPYYFVFMLAPVAVVTAPLLEKVARRLRPDMLGLALFAGSLLHVPLGASPTLAAQRTTLDAVHAIFPRGADYVDRCSMVASARKHGFFMSTWGMEVYRDAGRPIMRDLLIRHRPAFVLVNSPILEWALAGIGDDKRMLPEDSADLRRNFIPHWGPIWVAGKRVRIAGRAARFEMLIAGRYTVEAARPLRIDGVERSPGSVFMIAAGDHAVEGEEGEIFTLRWGDHLPRPKLRPPASTLFDPL
jgi:hypothetical protein